MKSKTTTDTDIQFEVSYGAKNLKDRKTTKVKSEEKALELFRAKEKDFHVSVEKVETTRTVKRIKIA